MRRSTYKTKLVYGETVVLPSYQWQGTSVPEVRTKYVHGVTEKSPVYSGHTAAKRAVSTVNAIQYWARAFCLTDTPT